MSIKVFISYAHADQELHKKLVEHLSPLQRLGEISIWQDQEIPPGADWQDQINTHLNEADLILLLVSASFIASNYCWNQEVQTALQRHKAGTAQVIPVILRPADWQQTPLGQLQTLPAGGKSIAQWNDQDAAFADVAEGIRKVVENLLRTFREEVQQTEGRRKPNKYHLTFAQLKRWYVVIPLILVLLGGSVGVYGATTGKWPWSPNVSYGPSTSIWYPHAFGISQNLQGVVWSGSQFVAIGESGTILTSLNGSVWTAQNSHTSVDLHGVAWSSSQFVAVGDNGTILISPDAITWTAQNTGTSQKLWGVAWVGSQFVALGEGGTILTSLNGSVWTAYDAETKQILSDVAWSGSQFVVVGNNGTVRTSPNGHTWTLQDARTMQDLWGVAWSDSQFVVAGVGGTILTSPDGSIWTAQNSHTSVDLVRVFWLGSQFVIVGSNGTILTSSNGNAWTAQNSSTTQNLRGVAWSGHQFVAVGDSGTILTSS